MIKTDYSTQPQPAFVDLFNNGSLFRVFYNRTNRVVTDPMPVEDGEQPIERTEYIANYVDIERNTRECFIQHLMQLQYPTVADEIALINNYNKGENVDEYNAYQQYRDYCKQVAHEVYPQ